MFVRTRPDPSLARAARRTVALYAVTALVIALGGFSVLLLGAAGLLWSVPVVVAITVALTLIIGMAAADHLDRLRAARRADAPPVATAEDLLAIADGAGVSSQFPARQVPHTRIGRHSKAFANADVAVTTVLRVVKP